MMFVSDASDPWSLVSRYVAALAPGSYLSLSHLTDDYKPPVAAEGFRMVFDTATEHMYFRSKAKVERFFSGLELVSAVRGRGARRHLHRLVGSRGRRTRGQRGLALAVLRGGQEAVTGKPTVAELGIDLAAQIWHRSGRGTAASRSRSSARRTPTGPTGRAPMHLVRRRQPANPPDRTEWVLMRVAGDPDQRVLVFDRHEWECFLDGARNGEFDDAAAPVGAPAKSVPAP